MSITTTARPTETREDALRRLLQVARESGVRLGVDHAGDYWATSVSEPGRLYPVGPESCGCRGFATHRRCRHLAALWSHLGYLDPEPDPAGAARGGWVVAGRDTVISGRPRCPAPIASRSRPDHLQNL